jgi:hypothetical protein
MLTLEGRESLKGPEGDVRGWRENGYRSGAGKRKELARELGHLR